MQGWATLVGPYGRHGRGGGGAEVGRVRQTLARRAQSQGTSQANRSHMPLQQAKGGRAAEELSRRLAAELAVLLPGGGAEGGGGAGGGGSRTRAALHAPGHAATGAAASSLGAWPNADASSSYVAGKGIDAWKLSRG